MLKEHLHNLLAQSSSVYVNYPANPALVDGGVLAEVATSPLTGEADNQVVRLSWNTALTQPGAAVALTKPCSVVLTEASLSAARVKENDSVLFELPDDDGEMMEVMCVKKLAGILSLEHADPSAYLVVQEDGNGNLQLHAHERIEDAVADRMTCAHGAYRTTAPLAVPRSLLRNPDFFAIAEALMRSNDNLSFPDNFKEDADA